MCWLDYQSKMGCPDNLIALIQPDLMLDKCGQIVMTGLLGALEPAAGSDFPPADG